MSHYWARFRPNIDNYNLSSLTKHFSHTNVTIMEHYWSENRAILGKLYYRTMSAIIGPEMWRFEHQYSPRKFFHFSANITGPIMGLFSCLDISHSGSSSIVTLTQQMWISNFITLKFSKYSFKSKNVSWIIIIGI